MELRVLTPDDWRVWREARLRALTEAAGAFGASLAEWEAADERRWRQRLTDVPLNVVAIDDWEVVAGQASGTSVDDANRIELISMWVAPQVRGTGVADALITAVAGYGIDAGAAAVRLSVRRTNERAIRFYKRASFDLVDEPGDEPAEIAMVRHLRP